MCVCVCLWEGSWIRDSTCPVVLKGLKFLHLNNKMQGEELSYGFGVRVKVGGKPEWTINPDQGPVKIEVCVCVCLLNKHSALTHALSLYSMKSICANNLCGVKRLLILLLGCWNYWRIKFNTRTRERSSCLTSHSYIYFNGTLFALCGHAKLFFSPSLNEKC